MSTELERAIALFHSIGFWSSLFPFPKMWHSLTNVFALQIGRNFFSFHFLSYSILETAQGRFLAKFRIGVCHPQFENGTVS